MGKILKRLTPDCSVKEDGVGGKRLEAGRGVLTVIQERRWEAKLKSSDDQLGLHV